MFDGLKKKFSSFIDSLSKKEAEKGQEQAAEKGREAQVMAEPQPEVKEEPRQQPKPNPVHEPAKEVRSEPAPHIHTVVHEEATRKVQPAPAEPRQEQRSAPIPEETQMKVHESRIEHRPEPQHHSQQQHHHEEIKARVEVPKAHVSSVEQHVQAPKIEPEAHHPKVEEQAQRREPKVSTVTKIKGFFLGHVKISEKDADPFIESLKLGLLQSDVNYDVAEKISDNIRNTLVGREVNSKNIEGDIRQGIRDSIMGVLSKSSGISILNRVREKGDANQLPYKILFVGPNGAGKTTTMAKIASMLISNGMSCVLSASDTFRAAAIEQTIHHANKLGVNVIKGTYGADPASVAFDAIAHAKAHGIMVVLIDSAGRQETNKSLIEELKKISRVTAPDLKLFIGESISGNALLDQVKAINEAVKLDGIILTKLDVDAKGGNTLSILSDTTIPILYFGTGEKYTDIMPYDPQFIVDNILPNN